MKAMYLIPLLFTASAAQASLIEDSRAFEACQDRFKNINRSEEMGLRAGPVYTTAGTRGEYNYYFNATSTEGHFRVACRAHRIGKVRDISIEEGKWVFQTQQESYLAAS